MDVFRAGVTIYLGRMGDSLFPVSALLEYLAIHPPTPGPLLLLKSGHPFSRHTLVSEVRLTLSSAGLVVSIFNGYSFLIGAATAAAQAGITDLSIKHPCRWKLSAFTRYLCPPLQILASFSSHLLQ